MVLFKFSAMALVATSLIAPSTAHLTMNSPVPFGVDTLTKSPLANAKPGSPESDFPCKQRPGVYDITTMNNMKVGEPQLLSFDGTASHGGGTCQISVSLDPEPSANATWKIIQVFEGGCPTNLNGNSATHPFTYTIPNNFPNGRATLAWTWFNRIGNREIYMNCAPITVTGGSESLEYYDSLPDMYVINLPTSECSSVEMTNQKVPNPGQFILQDDTYSIGAASGPSCAASAAAQTQGVSNYDSTVVTDNGAATTAPASNGDVTGMPTGTPVASKAYSSPASSVAQTTAASQPAPSNGLLTISTAASSPLASSTPAQSPTTSTKDPAPVTSQPASSATFASPSASSNGTSNTTCSDEGAVVCSGTSLFGLCDHGSVVFMPVSDGTECMNGQVVKKRSLNSEGKRNVHLRLHARHLGSGVHDIK
ncbi:lytic polysaccharide monooxygenase [Acrodontium crateriforme]|uniref:Lytic polysaccharide monooxygenase n=1 Tax=Acrodontium crateriforme TaxID=150365 RepID=A0AAQ3M6G4_9PEZI|nr:lytic polysaccharide monooxygenase [Acrodontium crateriforme]